MLKGRPGVPDKLRPVKFLLVDVSEHFPRLIELFEFAK